MRTLQVDLGDRSYPIYIGAGLLQRAELYRQHVRGRQVMVVSNETVAPLYLEQLRQALSYLFDNTVAQKVLTIIHNTDK